MEKGLFDRIVLGGAQMVEREIFCINGLQRVAVTKKDICCPDSDKRP
jgi:hypothetical protein